MEFRLQEDGLLIGAYFGSGNTNVIFCPGLPQYPSNYHPFIQDLIATGCNIFVPRYKGTWESDGDFSPQSSIESVAKAIDIAKRGSIFETFSEKKKDWTPGLRTVLIGFSYGAMPALANSHLADKTILLMPFLYPLRDDPSTIEMTKTLDFLKRGYRNVYRSSSDTRGFMEYVGVYDKLESQLNQPVLIIQGEKDKVISKRQLDWAQKHTNAEIKPINIGHSANIGFELYRQIVD